MANEKSCWFKGFLGCGCFTGLVILMIAAVVGIAYNNTNFEPELIPLEDIQQIEGAAEPAANLELGQNASATMPRVRVETSVSGVLFRIEAGEDNNFQLDGNYDAESFDVSTEVVEVDGQPTYRLNMHPKKTLRFNFLKRGKSTEVTLRVPKNMALDIDLEIEATETRLDLTNVAVASLNAELGKGSYRIACDAPNPIEAETMDINMQMGEMRFEEPANLRFRKGTINGRMGASVIQASEPFTDGTELWVQQSMGAMMLQVPRANALKANITRKEGNITIDEESEDRPLITITGEVSMGDCQLSRTGKAP